MQTERSSIRGMTCSGCVNTVTRALRAIDGVHATDVSLESGTAVVQFDQQLASIEDLALAVRRAGYDTTSSGEPAGRKPTVVVAAANGNQP